MRQCRSRLIHCDPARRWRGFTLAELLIALALIVLLAAAIFGAVAMYVRLTSAGQRQVLKAQITRAVLRQMQEDLSGVVFTVPQAEVEEETDDLSLMSDSTSSSSSDGTTDDTTDAEEITLSVEDPSTLIASEALGLVGDAQTLMLHVSRPVHPVRLSTTLTEQADLMLSDEKVVAWFLTGPGQSGYGSLTPVNAPLDGSEVVGLSRMEGDRFTLQLSEDQGSEEQLALMTRLLAPEIQQLQFEYFDGTSWLTEWDSKAIGRLPQAVRVVFGLVLSDPGRNVGGFGSTTTTAPTIEYVTHVLRLPRQAPYVENYGL
ncbi:MAG: prepilin-type N-terminal cleavage/methylation domain-containing protein [Planctomycetaceae bacterium]|nr:prepilin-type N-terminal cleavage/methylation domain-containing protein [Planctomycetaceae bacterium]